MHSSLYMLCCLHIFIFIETTSTTCTFNLETTLEGKTPIVLQRGIILNPDNRDGNVTLQNDDVVELVCSGRNNYFGLSRRIGQTVNATCNNNTFDLDRFGRHNFTSLNCKKNPLPEAKETETCNLQSKGIQIGFQITPDKFLPLMQTCFNASKLQTYWTLHELKTSAYSCQTADTTSFKKDFFVNVDPDRIYQQHSQIDKGHLSPKCDFFTGPEKRMTYYYVNSSPQREKFNRENWRDLEAVIRSAANQNHKHLYIYTGTANTVQRLGNKIPMQLYFWKAVIDPASGQGVAFVGINVQERKDCPCQEVNCNRLNWFSRTFIPKMSDVNKGIIYCCTIQSLQNISNIQLPQFQGFSGGLLRNM